MREILLSILVILPTFTFTFGQIYDMFTPVNTRINIFGVGYDGTNLYAGSEYGFFYSSDKGIDWEQRGDADRTYFVYLASQNRLFWSSGEKGLLRSIDGGVNWVKVQGGGVRAMIEVTSSIFLLGLESGIVMKSTDGGVNWYTVYYRERPIRSFGKGTDGYVYAGSFSGGIMYSTDRGNNWTVPDVVVQDEFFFRICESIVVDKSNHIYAGTSDNHGIYKSENHGHTWTKVLSNGSCYSIDINANGDMLASMGSALYHCTNGSDNWDNITGLMNFRTINTIEYADNEIFLGTLTGFYYSSNTGTTWNKRNATGWYEVEIEDMLLTPGNNMFATAYSGEVLRYLEEMGEWDANLLPFGAGFPTSLSYIEDRLYLGQRDKPGCYYYSDDLGDSWVLVNTTIGSYSHGTGFVKVNDRFNNALIASSGDWNAHEPLPGRIIKSEDEGTSWKVVYSSNNQITRLVTTSNKNVFAMASYTDGVIRSTDFGETWETVFSIVPPPGFWDVRFIDLICLEGNILIVGTWGGMWRSTDYGETWQESLPRWIDSFISYNQNSELFTVAEAGEYPNQYLDFYHSTNKGVSWAIYDPGKLKNATKKVTITDDELEFKDMIFSQDNYALMGTNKGVMISGTPFVTSVENQESIKPDNCYLYQNYPNPFNPVTRINYELPKESSVKLIVYNSVGEIVSILENERKQAGRYTIDFDGSNLASGVYYYSLTADNYREVRKMVLLK